VCGRQLIGDSPTLANRDTAEPTACQGKPSGVAADLLGHALPALRLGCYAGTLVDLRDLGRYLVIYTYPGCLCSPDDGYESPALDATQHRAFAARYGDFIAMGCRPIGVSSQSVEQQRRLAADTSTNHLLLSDPEVSLGRALGLRTFSVDGADWYCRVTLVVSEGRVAHAFYAVGSPALSAALAISWMRGQGS
jgi:peroxiredoxin